VVSSGIVVIAVAVVVVVVFIDREECDEVQGERSCCDNKPKGGRESVGGWQLLSSYCENLVVTAEMVLIGAQPQKRLQMLQMLQMDRWE
jgi:hypothetical protein